MNLLEKVVLLESEADDFGFRWDNTDQIMEQIKSECQEIDEHLQDLTSDPKKIKLQEEIGDLLHAVFSLCVFCKLDPAETLENTLKKFQRRLTAVKAIANEQGLSSLKTYSFPELMLIWKQAKKMVG